MVVQSLGKGLAEKVRDGSATYVVGAEDDGKKSGMSVDGLG